MNMKIVIRWAVRGFLIALILWWMIIIFGFSAADGVESSSFSDEITMKVVCIIEPEYSNLSMDKQNVIFNKVSFVVRKTGHFGEYGILSVLWSLLLLSFKKIRNMKNFLIVMIPTVICLVYAATDELHQGFVDGRSPKVMDVIIDTMGGLAGAGVIIILWMIIRRKNERVGKEH
ncbi:MAG: VanZ family protein [Eubacterium sp.]|nr:VanZ family protein [Eubacterium sp.]